MTAKISPSDEQTTENIAVTMARDIEPVGNGRDRSETEKPAPVEFAILLTATKPEYVNLINAAVIQTIQNVLEYGEEKGIRSFDKPPDYHICRAKDHLKTLYSTNRQPEEDDLAHALTRCYILEAKRKSAPIGSGENVIYFDPNEDQGYGVTVSEEEMEGFADEKIAD